MPQHFQSFLYIHSADYTIGSGNPIQLLNDMLVILVDECFVFLNGIFLLTQRTYFCGIFTNLCDSGFTDFGIIFAVFLYPVIQFSISGLDLFLCLFKTYRQ